MFNTTFSAARIAVNFSVKATLMAAVLGLFSYQSPAQDDFDDRLPPKLKEQIQKAQEQAEKALKNFDENFKNAAVEKRYMLGIMIEDAENGVRITRVMDDSAAEKAGLKTGDVVTAVNDQQLESIKELIDAAFQSKGKKITLKITRDGEEKKIEVVPKQVTVQIPNLQVPQFDFDFKQIPKNLHGSLKEYQKAIEKFKLSELPDNVSITITKTGKNPTEITVSRNDDVWKIKEDEIDELPKDLRPFVTRMLGNRPMIYMPNFKSLGDFAPGDARPQGFKFEFDNEKKSDKSDKTTEPKSRPKSDALEKQLERLMKRLEQLERKLEKGDKR